ncbi:MAG TPA: hypothetical protein VM509_12175 [Planctomycetota bacterium]|nr:hypothetical protein [Planctomycetota bacterium]
MSDSQAIELERLLADVLTDADPAQAVERALTDPNIAEETRAALESIDLDGLRVSALLVAKLRFERLLQGSARAGERFETDPRGFSAEFKRYHLEVPPRSSTPSEEARSFDFWRKAEQAN